jgi:hypothetical protein
MQVPHSIAGPRQLKLIRDEEIDMQSGKTVATVVPRSLGALEKLFWLNHQNRPMHFAIAAEVSGPAPIEQWQDALDRVCRQSPLIWSRIIRDENGVPVFSPVSSVPVPLHPTPSTSVPLHVVENAVSKWTDHVAGELARPFDASRAPLLRATLLHGEDRSVIILCAHHSIADGLALSFLMRDVLRAFAGESAQLSTETASVEHLLSTGSHSVTAPQANGSHADRPPMSFRPLDGSPRIEDMRFTRERTLSLRERARSEGSTLHGALCAAVAMAVSGSGSGAPGAPLRVLSPVDIRARMLNGTEHFGLYSTGVTLEDECGTDDFWTRARSFSDRLGAVTSTESISTRIRMLDHAVSTIWTVRQAQELFAQRFSAEILLTNLGAVEFQHTYGSLTLHALWGPAVVNCFANAHTVAAVTVLGRLHLLHISYEPASGLLDEVSLLLSAALKGTSDLAPRIRHPQDTALFPETR